MSFAHPVGVLVTRPASTAGRTEQALRTAGFTPIACPCIAIRPRPARLPAAARVQALLVSSAQALPALPPAFHPLPLLAVGDATAAQARAHFPQVHSADGDAVALAALAARLCNPKGGPLLLVTGAGLGAPLCADLRQRGFRVLRRVVYEQRQAISLPGPALKALEEGQVRAALFFSRETALTFKRRLNFACYPLLQPVEALAIGQTTAAALSPMPWLRVRVASRPTQEELLALLHD